MMSANADTLNQIISNPKKIAECAIYLIQKSPATVQDSIQLKQ